MFVRKKKNNSGSVSVQVIDKTKGYRVAKTVGSSKIPEEIKRMVATGAAFIDGQKKQYSLFPKEQERNAHYQFVVGARIKNETEKIQKEILKRSANLSNGESLIIEKPNGHRLIVSYSDKRAKKDLYNRDKGLKKLRRRVRSGKLTKEQINNRGYNKFLRLQGEVKIEIDESKIEQAAHWDGLKGYLTNTDHSADTIIENYQQLWHVEKAFRISKTDLRIRPIHHYKEKRIRAHILIAFVAYTIYKELERLLTQSNTPISPQRAVELTHTMYEMRFELPDDPEPQSVLLEMDKEQKLLYDLLY